MIGNDIIDLRFTAGHSKWQHPRFMDKLFRKQEQELINCSTQPFTAIWELWAKKEAAYKAYIQKHPSRFFNPKAFECTDTEVRYKDFKIKVQTAISPSMIYAETVSNKKVIRNIMRVSAHPREQSECLRRTLLNEASTTFKTELELLKIVFDQAGIPKLYKEDSILDVELSFTHHGSFAAYLLAYS